MVITKQVTLPTEEELSVQEINVSTPGLRAASFHMGKACENVNNVSIYNTTSIYNLQLIRSSSCSILLVLYKLNCEIVIISVWNFLYFNSFKQEFMLCRQEYRDPRKCLNEGKAVTSCSLDVFKQIKKNCAQEFGLFANCLDRSSPDFSFAP